MKVRIEDIPEDGLLVDIDQEDDWAVQAAAQALEGQVSDLSVSVQLDRIAELLRVHGQARATVVRPCDRCGGDIRLSVSGPVELLFEPHRPATHAEEHITDPTELDLGFFDGKELDLTDVVMEQLALWLPERLRCGDPGVQQVGAPWTCALPAQDPGPPTDRHKPFANLRLPD
ncbi:DUF177 domain-containing protein [Myxococcota bacterium]|nr:DUF177 domain-containing protein [Myxococcota bacterium]